MTHPARYSAPLLDVLARLMEADCPHAHDPFAGTGERLGALCDELRVSFSGTELEAPFIVDGRVRQGDARDPLTYPAGRPFWVVTSPVYPNGMTDNFKPSGRCSACGGRGRFGPYPARFGLGWECDPCPKCEGTGRRAIDRATYRIRAAQLAGDPDYELAEGNMGAYGYRAGRKAARRYWQLAREVVAQWDRAERVVVNVSDHYQLDRRVPVVKGWRLVLAAAGWKLEPTINVVTQRYRKGANAGKRAPAEAVIVGRRAP